MINDVWVLQNPSNMRASQGETCFMYIIFPFQFPDPILQRNGHGVMMGMIHDSHQEKNEQAVLMKIN